MDFSDWFRSSKDNLSAFAPAPNTQKTLDNLFPLSAATQPHFIDSDDVETSVDRLLSIPLDKRMHLMLDSDVYKKAHQEMLDKEVNRIKKAQLERAKKQHPEWGNDVGLKNVRFSEEAFEALQDQLAKTFLSAILRPSEIDQAYANLLNPQKKLSLADKKVLTIFLYVWKHNLSVLTRKFGVRNGAFQSIIAKGATELSDIIGQALKDDPKALLLYGAKCCLDHKGFDVSDLTFGADRWVARWLPQKLTRALICGKPMIPTIGTETAEPTQKDITRLQRYQHSFNRALLYYLIKSPTQAQDVFKLVFPNITKMKPDMQEQLWSVLFHKYRVDPEIRSDVVSFMTTFLAQEKDLKAKKAMYGVFVHILPPDKRADILGHFPTKALSKYWATFAPIYPQTTFASVRTDTETT
ncbi:MAG: hypothetical protein SPL08_04670, partial [Pseudomonadota bacterium]|nr:hypothetical protein [Pseudomonadota bacterium]